MKLIILDGHSCVGKSLVRRFIYSKYKSDVILLDRFTPSNWVFSYLRGKNNTKEILEFEKIFNLLFKPIVVILHCDTLEAEKRSVSKDEFLEFSIDDEKDAFNKYLEISSYSDIVKIDTSNLGVKELAKKVMEIINEYKR